MNHIAILDFGSQYTHLIARRVRDLQVLAKIYRNDIKPAKLPKDVAGIILSGGPQSVYGKKSASIDAGIFELGIPVLGLCYGHQLMAKILGGKVREGRIKEYGRADLRLKRTSRLLIGVQKKTRVWMSHGDAVSRLPKGFLTIGATADCPIAAMADETNKFYGLQFHPEVHHTSAGKKILRNFVFNICRAEQNWKIGDILTHLIARIRKQAGKKKVFLLVSGGVDSTVCFALLEKALGKANVYGLHIDTGFMRLDESKEVKNALAQAGFDNLHIVDASRTFYKNLKAVTDPEQKRRIIGQTFLDIKDELADKLKLNPKEWLLGQGTIYPDTIESGGTRHADRIKTHHNRVDAVQKLIKQGLVIEPLTDFYKDEVRKIGRLLGLASEIIDRHPFPGPGLAIRILCTPKTPPPARPASPERQRGEGGGWGEAGEESEKLSSLKPSRSFDRAGTLPSPCLPGIRRGACPAEWPGKGEGVRFSLLPIRSVGVQGDNRTYAHPLAIWGLPAPKEENKYWEKLDALASRITNASKEINRVLLLLNPPAGKKRPDPAIRRAGFSRPDKKIFLTPARIRLLQKIDNLVMTEIKNKKLYGKIWQFPVALIPVGDKNQESIVLRPVVSQEAMTAHFARLPWSFLKSLTKKIIAADKIDYVFFDLTNKPPGTIEWE